MAAINGVRSAACARVRTSSRQRAVIVCLAATAVLLCAGVASAQVRARGVESVATAGDGPGFQISPSVTYGGRGGPVVAWGEPLASTDGRNVIRARKLRRRGDSDDMFVSEKLLDIGVNISRTPHVAAAQDGSFAITWSAELSSVWARFYDRRGAPLADPFLVADTGDGRHPLILPKIARLPNGRTMIVWNGGPGSSSRNGHAMGRIYDANGAALTDAFRLDETGSREYAPRVSTVGDSQFIVAWAGIGVEVRRFDADGQPLGDTMMVSDVGEFAEQPDIAVADDGGFMVVWEGADPPAHHATQTGIFGRRFDADDSPLGPVVHINSFIFSHQFSSVVEADGRGGFIVIWVSDQQDISDFGVFGRRLNNDGTTDGFEFQLNTITAEAQGDGGLDLAVRNGRAAAVWYDRPYTEIRYLRVRPGKGPLCGDANARDLHLELRDALRILKSAADPTISCVGCLCDTNGSGTVTAEDALRLMKKIVGGKGRLECPPCAAEDDSRAGIGSLLPPGL